MFEIDGKSYILKYNIDRVEMIENSIGMPTMSDLYSHKGMLSLSALKAYLAHGLKEEGSDSFVPVKKGLEMLWWRLLRGTALFSSGRINQSSIPESGTGS